MSKADDVAREGELDDLVVSVVPTQVVAERAALDTEQLFAAISCVEKRLAAGQPAHAAGADAANRRRCPKQDAARRNGGRRANMELLSRVGADDMGIGAATIKPKS